MLVFDFYEILMENLFGGVLWLGDIIYSLLAFGVGTAAYVLTAYSLYAIAKSRGIKHGWLAWLPFGGSWILGSIADQYQYVSKGKVKSKRKSLLILEILINVAAYALLISFIVPLFQVLFAAGDMVTPDELLMLIFKQLGTVILLYLALLGLSVAQTVIRYMALFDLYRSCDPDNAELFLILSIFVSFVQPVLLFLDRNKEKGMPPRKTAQPEVTAEYPFDEE